MTNKNTQIHNNETDSDEFLRDSALEEKRNEYLRKFIAFHNKCENISLDNLHTLVSVIYYELTAIRAQAEQWATGHNHRRLT